MSRLALVTGAGRRIGREIALTLAAKGYDVVVHYKASREEAESVRLACLAAGASFAYTLCCDLTERSSRSELLSRAGVLAGRPVDLLVNSASIFNYDTAESFSMGGLEEHLEVNFIAATDLTLRLYAAHKQAGTVGHSITLLDQKVENLNPDYLSYTLSKLAAKASIRMLAQSCAPSIRVNAISPGVTLVSGDMGEQEFEKAHRVAALGQSSTARDIADAVLMLDLARAVTGQSIAVDGGQHLVPLARDVAFEA